MFNYSIAQCSINSFTQFNLFAYCSAIHYRLVIPMVIHQISLVIAISLVVGVQADCRPSGTEASCMPEAALVRPVCSCLTVNCLPSLSFIVHWCCSSLSFIVHWCCLFIVIVHRSLVLVIAIVHRYRSSLLFTVIVHRRLLLCCGYHACSLVMSERREWYPPPISPRCVAPIRPMGTTYVALLVGMFAAQVLHSLGFSIPLLWWE